MGWSYFDSLFIVSGALGLFSREAVLAVGGYRTDTLRRGHGTGDASAALGRPPRPTRARPNSWAPAVAWTEVPESSGRSRRQRAPLAPGASPSRSGSIATCCFANAFQCAQGLAYLSQILVELLGPVVELFGYVIFLGLVFTGQPDTTFAVLYLGIFVAGGTIASLLGIALETFVCPRYRRTRDFLGLVLYALLENFGYRQLTAAWRVMGLWRALTRHRQWGSTARRGHRSGSQPVDDTMRRAA